MTSSESRTRRSFSRTGSANDRRVDSTADGGGGGELQTSPSGDSEQDSIVVEQSAAVSGSPAVVDHAMPTGLRGPLYDDLRDVVSDIQSHLNRRVASCKHATATEAARRFSQ